MALAAEEAEPGDEPEAPDGPDGALPDADEAAALWPCPPELEVPALSLPEELVLFDEAPGPVAEPPPEDVDTMTTGFREPAE